MTRGACRNAAAAHFEPFKDVAFKELEAAPLIAPGVCFHPDCSTRFDPTRSWQIYCSARCREADSAEFRAWGHKAALPILVHRMGNKSKDGAVRALTRVARNYTWRLSSEMYADRRARRAAVSK